MSRMLPFPGRYESHDSWMRRCDEWEANRRSWNSYSGGLSGKPKKQGIVELDGITITRRFSRNVYPNAVRIGYGWRASVAVERFARQNGFDFIRFNGNGSHGMCKRLDGVAYKGEKWAAIQAVYNRD